MPDDNIGILPTAFAIPALIGLALLARKTPIDSPRTKQSAYLAGGVTLSFITLIFPLQSEREWITGARIASIGLFLATLLKLFCHDLWQLDQLHRVAAFIIVSVIAMFAPFLYQRFLGSRQARD